MELPSDLETDLAVAFLIEKRHSDRLRLRDAKHLIERITGLIEAADLGKTEYAAARPASPDTPQ